MKLTVVSTRETRRVRHFSLDLKVEHNGKTSDLSVTMIENCETPCTRPTYEIESMEWTSDIEGVDTDDLEKKVEGYLIDTAEDILAGG
jgi:hypothetical protein